MDNHIIRIISLKNRRVRTLCGTPQVEGFENGIHNQSKFRLSLRIRIRYQL